MHSQSNVIVLFKKRDDALVTESPESCSNGISEPKRRKFLAMSFADKVILFVKTGILT